MAVANLIGAVVGVFLLLLVAYLLVGATLVTAETVMSAQREMTDVQVTTVRTSIVIEDYTLTEDQLYLLITNDGATIIDPEPESMDVYLANDLFTQMVRASWTQEGAITPDGINPGLLDPGESLNMSINISGVANASWVKVATPNGITASSYL
ncbi:hypothetical protein RJ53_02340 [Methanocalculus chunghsingensis]|uniref:Flagellar protein FlaF n=1 Tax=Methanocalculus chunghsingensis TaxID=156457 RepID=A0A8J7W501_9EURY|nr:hypothetical protein [Methanocalculus chunghsingensis]MBR1368399.1 hypothetical protein [Methanocalculus chunghsingensis]